MVDCPAEDGPMHKWSKVEAVKGAAELLQVLSQTASCYLATNAKDSTEDDIIKALARADLDKYIKEVFCYQSIGSEKPSKDFFNYVLTVLQADKNDVVMIGDSLKNDVMGALDFGFDAIWFNTENYRAPENIISIQSLLQLISS